MSACSGDDDKRIHAIQSRIRVVPDFPKKGTHRQETSQSLCYYYYYYYFVYLSVYF